MNEFEPYLPILKQALKKLDLWRSSYGSTSSKNSLPDQFSEIQEITRKLTTRVNGNYPFHHPSYAGQMLKPPHPIAWLSYALVMTINPNNHALDGGPPTSEMEKEVIKKLTGMIGYDSNSLGHLTSGGTIANLEALFIAREIHPEKAIAASANAHYTHQRMCRVLNCNFIKIPVDKNGIPDLDFISKHAADIGTIVVTMGTTGLGLVEPLQEILQLAKLNGIRVHIDAAYGGFFKLIANELSSKKHWELLSESDSIVIDPHKHGLQPYGCGSVLYKDAAVGKYLKHDSPYTYFTSDELHLGEISLECSRAGASAAAFWTTLELLPLTQRGLGRILSSTIRAGKKFVSGIFNLDDWKLYIEPDLDIVTYFKVPKQKTISALNKTNQDVFDKGISLDKQGYHLSLFKVSSEQFISRFPDFRSDADHALILRSVFMKEEHEEFVDEQIKRLTSI